MLENPSKILPLANDGSGSTPDAPASWQASLTAARAQAEARFATGTRAQSVLTQYSAAIDALLRDMCNHLATPDIEGKVAVIAVGGYGREALFPYSDIDLLLLSETRNNEAVKQFTGALVRAAWDLGLKLGHQLQPMEGCIALASQDATVASTLLDSRFIWGKERLAQRLATRLRAEVFGQHIVEFVDAKLKEREDRHRRHGASRFLLEPNVKEGKGGLRDLHSLAWLARYIYGVGKVGELVGKGVLSDSEARAYARAEHFLSTVRLHLHFLSGQAEERLTFDLQKRIAERMGFHARGQAKPIERFMKRYFQVARDVGYLTRVFCAVLEEDNKRKPRLRFARLHRKSIADGLVVEGHRIQFDRPERIAEEPILILHLFAEAQKHGLELHPRALQQVQWNLTRIDGELRRNAEANRLFLDMLTSRHAPDLTLRRLNEAGVLGRFIPDWQRVVAQMQYDMYHVFTVDEHTIQAIGNLARIEQGGSLEDLPLASELIKRVSSRRVLYLALFCHDIAKGRGGNHAQIGEQITRRLAKRFGLTDAEGDMASWLVKEHFIFSDTAFKRDLDDPKTIEDFVARVKSPERMRLLLLLTVCDIRAVGPTIWNGWKGSLMRELYRRAEWRMGSNDAPPRLGQADSPAGLSSSLWQVLDATEQELLRTVLAERADPPQAEASLRTRGDAFRAITTLVIALPRHPRLFEAMAGVLRVMGASIVHARLSQLDSGDMLAILGLQDVQANAFDTDRLQADLSSALAKALADPETLAKQVRAQRPPVGRRVEKFDIRPQIYIDNEASSYHSVIEINGGDRPGFLYDVTRAILSLNLTIATAHIATYGEAAVDVFYVKDSFGLKLDGKERSETIRQQLEAKLNPPKRGAA